jgi:hypothetical protein
MRKPRTFFAALASILLVATLLLGAFKTNEEPQQKLEPILVPVTVRSVDDEIDTAREQFTMAIKRKPRMSYPEFRGHISRIEDAYFKPTTRPGHGP